MPEETSVLRPQHWLKVAKSTHLLQRVFERPCRGILDGDRHLFLAFYGFKRHDEHVSQQDLLEILASFASSGQPVHPRVASQVSLFHTCEGAACCVDAHLPTVDERFRTCLQ